MFVPSYPEVRPQFYFVKSDNFTQRHNELWDSLQGIFV